MSRTWLPTWLPVLVGLAALAGCAAPYDGDGEAAPLVRAQMCGPGCAPGAPSAPVTPVVVDTDLGGDDLVALAFLLQHPEVRVEAITIAGTGLVGCDPGVDLVADLLTALQEDPVPIACGREEAGPGGRAFPQEWRDAAAAGSGLPRDDGTLPAATRAAPELIGRLAADVDDLEVVELGPMTNLADLAASRPGAFARLAGIHAMGGSVAGPVVDGVAEWNVAADPEAFAAVLAAGVPLTVVPEDAVPSGTPSALSAPVVSSVAAAFGAAQWWDLAAAAALVAPGAGKVETGTWALDDSEPGRLRRDGDGPVRVVRSLDASALEAAYARAFVVG